MLTPSSSTMALEIKGYCIAEYKIQKQQAQLYTAHLADSSSSFGYSTDTAAILIVAW